jgi:Flp pilus assembly protein TadD
MSHARPQRPINEALALHQAGRVEDAYAAYRKILEGTPGEPVASHWLGVILFNQGNQSEGLELIRKSSIALPDRADFLQNLAAYLHRSRLYAEAVDTFRRALALKPKNPALHTGIAAALVYMGNTEGAERHAREAIAIDPTLAQPHVNLGLALRSSGRHELALEAQQRAVELAPGFPEARYNHAFALLMLGRYESGWREYEWRKKLPGAGGYRFSIPEWNGDPISSQTLLLHTEQGVGDTLHFLRYLPLAQSRSQATGIILTCQPPLLRFLKDNLPPDITVISTDELVSTPVVADAHAALLSLPLLLRAYTPEATPCPHLRVVTENRIDGAENVLRVGLVWAGNPRHTNDRQRSVPPETFLPLFDQPGVRFHSLQVPASAKDAASLKSAGLIDSAANLTDYADTAALIASLDLVITVDTSVAHLAGVLQKPVWTLIPPGNDWRWGAEGETSALYPTMRLFRRRPDEAWDAVIARVSVVLTELSLRRTQARGAGTK